MRIIQMIDSLEVGGAEKMAVNYANALSNQIEFSGLIATRKQGNLINQIDKKVSYLFLDRKKVFDLKAVKALKKYCQENKVHYIHAHGTSYFTAFLVKLIYPNVKIIWHDHYGMSEFLSDRKATVLKMSSFFFSGIITVNFQLKNWSEKKMYCKKVIYLPNFTNNTTNITVETKLKGCDGKRILCLANLREQKNHFLLLEIAVKIKNSHPDWTFHLVGKDFGDSYSKQIKQLILIKKLDKIVFVYGTKNDSVNIINQADICIFTSNSEGLPVALLEYGLQKKPVVSTNVGEIPLIINNNNNGYIVPANNAEIFTSYLLKLIKDKDLRENFGMALYYTILENNSEKIVINNYLKWISSR
jgi:glycosyltransferase involved in cell wall biosynthesis